MPEVFEGDAIRSDLAVPRLRNTSATASMKPRLISAKALGKSAAELSGTSTTKSLPIKSRRNRARLCRPHFAWSRHGIAACFSRMSNWSLIIWAS